MNILGVKDLKEYQKVMKEKEDTFEYSLMGKDGCCFIDGDKIIKVYLTPILKEYMCDLSKYQSDRISFPIYYVKDSIKYYAEVMPYFPYKTIDCGIMERTNIEKLMNHRQVMRDEIKKFKNIHMVDMDFIWNIMYDEEKGFYLIDVTSWDVYEYPMELKNNLRKLDKEIYLVIKNYVTNNACDIKVMEELDSNFRILRKDRRGIDFLRLLKDNVYYVNNFKELMDAFIDIVKTYYQEDIETVSDVKKYMKMMKNS